MKDWTVKYYLMTKIFERFLAFIVLLGIITMFLFSVQYFLTANWADVDAFYELINRILLIVIGLELIRMLITHDMRAVLELLAFVIARKMLRPELSSMDIALSVISFSVLFVIYKIFNDKDSVQKVLKSFKNEK